MPANADDHDPLFEAILNLSRFHREHEKYYAQAPLEDAVRLQRHARVLQALADRWSRVDPSTDTAPSPYAGCEDLNDPAALQLDGVLFMEGEGEPAEITRLEEDLKRIAGASDETGMWLERAMHASWDVARALLGYPELADLLGERHRIIANDWQAANMTRLVSAVLDRGAEILDAVDFSPGEIRDDLGDGRTSPGRLYSAAELIDHAADLLTSSAQLVHDNERRWRVFRARIVELRGGPAG